LLAINWLDSGYKCLFLLRIHGRDDARGAWNSMAEYFPIGQADFKNIGISA
jgi:hypothetical protein